jgi:penicillin-binding protein 1A
MDTIVQLARRFGIDAPVAPYPASAIGASALQPLDLVGAYTVFANLGAHVDPRFIYRIEDRAGSAVFTNPAAPPRAVIDPKVAFIVRDMMREVVERGTATSVRRYLPANIPVAGKTGTTNDNSDVWFVGMTPEIVAGVWLGFDKPKTITPGAAGGTLAAPIFGKMIAEYYAARGAAEWTPPQGLIAAQLDRVSGQLADSTTPPERRYMEYFIEGTEPLPLRVNGWQLFKNGPIVF